MKADYTTIIRENAGLAEVEDVPVQQNKEQLEDQIKAAHRIQWLQDMQTTVMFNEISREIETMETRARELACQYHNNNNHQEIISLLVRSSELRKLKATYASTSIRTNSWW